MQWSCSTISQKLSVTISFVAKKRLSLAMQDALRCAKRHGSLRRYVGGYWSHPDAPIINNAAPDPWWSTGTIQALVERGLLRVVATRAGGKDWLRVAPADGGPDAG